MELWPGAADNSWETVQDELQTRYRGDGLPLIPPDAVRVAAMLNGRDAAAEIAMLPPGFDTATAGDIAICAVLAGCRPACFPVLTAAVSAMADMAFNLVGIATTTGSAAPMLIINGPVVRQIGLHAGGNVLGGGHPANATIGRAIGLILRNIGAAIPGETDMATLGQPAKLGCCIAENEVDSPWPPLHVERGFSPSQSVVTVVGISGSVEVNDSDSTDATGMAQTFAHSMLIAGNAGGSGLLGGGEPLCLLPPEWAAALHAEGLNKAQAKELIWERACLPADRLAPAVQARRRAASNTAEATIRIAEKADDLMIVVAGGVGRKAAYLPTWGGGTRAISREILC